MISGPVAAVRVWSDMIKLHHSVFALPFAVMAAFLAGRHVEGLHRPYGGQLALVRLGRGVIRAVGAYIIFLRFGRACLSGDGQPL